MSELNTDVPAFNALLKKEYLYDMKSHYGELVPCYVFGITSIPSRAIGFHVMLENGACIDRLPLSAIVHKPDAPNIPLDHLELWDCFSYNVAVIAYGYLRSLRCAVMLKNKQWAEGTYEFTIDWYGESAPDDPGEGGHKSAHVIRLHNGCFAAQPNNRIRWYEPSFVTVPFPARPDYQVNTHIWSVENKGDKWVTSNDNNQFYDVEPILE